MPLDWAHAFGGPEEPRNPLGKGAAQIETSAGPLQFLPNVENPTGLVVSPDDRPEPVGFLPLDVSWPQRQALVGTRYDARWLAELSPGPAEDFDVGFYGMAPRDQQFDGPFRAGDVVSVTGMHPTKPRVELAIPDLVVRVFTAKTIMGRPSLVPFETRLDTVFLVPHAERAFLVYRASFAVEEDDANDVAGLVLAAEDPSRPRDLTHYEEALANRLDKERGALAMLRDQDLLPPAELGWAVRSEFGDFDELTKFEQRALAKATKFREERIAAAQEAMVKAGFSPMDESVGYEPLDPTDPDALEVTSQQMLERSERELAEAKARSEEARVNAKRQLENAGIDDLSPEATEASPRFSIDEFLIAMHDMARLARENGAPLDDLERDLTDTRYNEQLLELERRAHAGYLETAHLLPARRPPNADRMSLLRATVEFAKEAGESLAGKNLVGADLTAMDLRGLDLSRALLDDADLSRSDLSGANLTDAVLARVRLDDASLIGACLRGANLGGARLVRTDLSSAILEGATLARATLDGALFHGATLTNADFLEVEFLEADFGHADLTEVLFLKADLRRVSFVGARLKGARVLECDLRGVDFTGCDLSGAQLVLTTGDGASFSGANLTGAVLLHESSFEGCGFAGANLTQANLGGTTLARSVFDGAKLDGANLHGSDLREARLRGVSARGGIWIRADLRGADVRGADLLGGLLSKGRWEGADLTNVNLSRADATRVRTDGRTKLAGALSLDTRVEPRHVDRTKPTRGQS